MDYSLNNTISPANRRITFGNCVILILLFVTLSASAQNSLNATGSNAFLRIQAQVEGGYDLAEGSPYLPNEWADGEINFTNNSRLEKIPVRFNVQGNYLEVKMKNNIYQADLGYVTNFSYLDPSSHEKWFFKRVIIDKTNNTFMRIILEGGITLGAYYSVRVIKGTKQESGYDVISHAKDKLNMVAIYYLITTKEPPIKLPRTKKGFVKRLPTHSKEVEGYINRNNLDIRKDEDLIKAISFYNSLL